MNTPIVIKPIEIFHFNQTYRVIAGHIIVAPRVFPRNVELRFYRADGSTKTIVVHAQITTSPEALRQNVHGFAYSGDTLHADDVAGDALISNLTYDEAQNMYNKQSKCCINLYRDSK